jgi:hypothetical protein
MLLPGKRDIAWFAALATSQRFERLHQLLMVDRHVKSYCTSSYRNVALQSDQAFKESSCRVAEAGRGQGQGRSCGFGMGSSSAFRARHRGALCAAHPPTLIRLDSQAHIQMASNMRRDVAAACVR